MTDAQVTGLIAAGAAISGALIGFLGGVARDLISTSAEKNRERARLAVQLALAEHERRIAAIKEKLLPPGQRALPLVLYFDYHARFIRAAEKGKLTPTTLTRLHNEHRAVKEALDNMPPYFIPKDN